ncbi:putative alanine racemase-domain-containing protein [Globomyces pollinis-pini]|nr:putative alanine racemase-domain-containing protein [Globomyces pollinis-pini]KAJ2995141.1 hypothetical protein HDV02_001026 [Globomyces sp. JEL0801]
MDRILSIINSPKENQKSILDRIVTDFKNDPNGLTVIRCTIQDNGYSAEWFPFISKNNVVSELLFRDTLGDGEEFVLPSSNFTMKYPHLCIKINDGSNLDVSTLSLEPSAEKEADIKAAIDKLIKEKLPGVDAKDAFVLKSYDESLPLNVVIDAYGVFEDPDVCEITPETTLKDLLPRFHCVYYKPVSELQLCEQVDVTNDDLIQRASELRKDVITMIKDVLLGDELAAEYFLLHLFSKITKRLSGIPTGSIGINLYHSEMSSTMVDKLADLTRQLKPLINLVSVTIESLNSLWMQPSQARYEGSEDVENGLYKGVLQAPEGSWFLLDETNMNVGTLTERGLNNIKTLQNAISFGSVEYGLHYGSLDREVDFGYCVIGKVASLLQLNTSVPIVSKPALEQNVEDSTQILQSVILSYMQTLIAIMREKTFTVSDKLESVIERDFIASQKKARDSQQPADDGSMLLHRLVVAESISKSFGLSELNESCWNRAGELESERLSRLSHKKK